TCCGEIFVSFSISVFLSVTKLYFLIYSGTIPREDKLVGLPLAYTAIFIYIGSLYIQYRFVEPIKNQAVSRPTPTTLARFWHMNTFIVLAIGCNLINLLYYAVDG